MSVKIRIPTPLRRFTGDKDIVETSGTTVRACVDELIKMHPDLGNQLLDQNGEVRRFVNLFLNDKDVRFQGGPAAIVKAGDEIAIIPAIAGGSNRPAIAGGTV